MKNQLLSFGTLLLGAALTISSCSKDTGSQAGVSYQVKPTNFTASVGSMASASGLVVTMNTNSSITWTSGYIQLSEIKLEAKKDQTEVEFKSKDLPAVDLFNLGPVFGKMTVLDGTYDEVELKLEIQKSQTSVVPLFLKGTYTEASGTKIPVEFSLNEDFELEVEAKNLVVTASTDYIALLNVQLNTFMNNITAGDMVNTTRVNGVIVINSTTNADLYNKFKTNIKAFGEAEFED